MEDTKGSPVVPAAIDPIVPSFSSLVRLRRLFSLSPIFAVNHAEQWIVRRLAHSGLFVSRIALGIIFLWFGAMKFLPVVLPIDQLAEKTLTTLTFHLFRAETCLHVLAAFECLIGIGLLTKRFLHLTVALLFFQMLGTFTPLILLRQETWAHFPLVPTFEGQYIIKNLVLITSGIIVGATVRGGRIIANPVVAAKAARVELDVEQRTFRERDDAAIQAEAEEQAKL